MHETLTHLPSGISCVAEADLIDVERRADPALPKATQA